MIRKLIVVVDMQYDFIDMPDGESKLPIPNSFPVIDAVFNRLKDLVYKPPGTLVEPDSVVGVLFTQDWHDVAHVEYDPSGNPFPQHCVENTQGADICIRDYQMFGQAYVPAYSLKKNVFDMFGEENRIQAFGKAAGKKTFSVERECWIDYMRQAHDFDTVEVMGVATDICVNFAVKGFLDRGFKVEVRRDCVKGLFREIDQVNAEDWGSAVTILE